MLPFVTTSRRQDGKFPIAMLQDQRPPTLRDLFGESRHIGHGTHIKTVSFQDHSDSPCLFRIISPWIVFVIARYTAPG